MKLLRYLLPLVVALGTVFVPTYADLGDRSDYEEELNERDFDALRQFINSKRTLDLQDKSCNLTISGDVRTEWRNIYEKCNGRNIIGSRKVKDDRCVIFGHNDFDIEFNLRLDYISDCAWAVAHVLYDNSAGVDGGIFNPKRKEAVNNPCKVCCDYEAEKIDNCCGDSCELTDRVIYINNKLIPGSNYGCRTKFNNDPWGWQGSGTRNDLNLRKAYMGINLYDECGKRFDFEIGRRNLYNVFDSKVQFLSRFDGILLKLTGYCECYADWYIYWGGFVVDERVNHYAWVVETGLENICDCCLDLKYSFINWPKKGRNRCNVENPIGFQYRNSQFTAAWHFNPDYLISQGKLYGAFLINHDAPDVRVTRVFARNEKGEPSLIGDSDDLCDQRFAWYVGFTIGKVCQAGDWAFDAQYQWVEYMSIPNNDVSGIGRGNFLNQSNTVNGIGNTNYKGYRLEFLYAFTDNLTLDTIYEHSNALNKKIGGAHSYSKFEMEAIYAF